jgi:two-component system sensor histidine kinase RegB
MPLSADPLGHSRRNVRINTLITLRWLAVAGQTIAVVAVHFLFDVELPLTACLSVIALSAWLNIALRMNYRYVQRLEPERVAWLLAYDIGQLSVLVYLTGGLENPFAFLILAPVLISAMALPLRMTLVLGLFAIICSTVIAVTYFEVPFTGQPVLAAPSRYLIAIWVADLVAIVFIGAYAWQIAEEGRLLADALAATEMVLMREQHLSQLDGLAAAAAHELGTPLATIAVIAKELERALGPASPHTGDMKLLREQTQRCRDILAKLTALSPDGAPYDRPKLSALIDEVIAPHRNFGIAIDVVLPPDRAGEPVTIRSPAPASRRRSARASANRT